MLIVGGVVHHRVPEPVYHLRSFGGFDRFFSIKTVHADDVKPEADPTEFFRADRLDDAVAEYERLTGEKLDAERRAEVVAGFVEVLLPEALSFRYDMRPRVMVEAAQFLRWMEGDLATKDIAFASAFIRLRDATATAVPDHERIVAVVADEIVPAMRSNDTAEWEIDRASALVDAWRNREDSSLVRDADLAALAG
jgi:hypothetical protein